jgi:hypothetical protein
MRRRWIRRGGAAESEVAALSRSTARKVVAPAELTAEFRPVAGRIDWTYSARQ